jgi:hypothetical protein
MQTIRRWARFGFGVQALVTLAAVFVAFLGIARLRQAAGDDEALQPTYRLMIAAALVLPLLSAIPALAWWTIKKGRPAARRWTIATAALNSLIVVAGIRAWTRMGHLRTWPYYALCGITAVLGVIGFWRNEGPNVAPKRVRVSGDGTSNLKDYVAQGASIGIMWLAAGGWSRWATAHDLPYPSLVPFIAQMEIAVLLTTFGHELGHLFAGWVSGKILRSFHVGPFRWAIRNGEWRFEFNLRKFYGGSVGMVPPDLINMRSRKAFSLIGGPVASLVMGSICTVATLLTPGHIWQPYWMLLSMMATFSLAGFVVNLIPLKPESNYSDGAQLYQVVTNGPWARVHFAFAMVTSSLVAPVRPRNFDVNVINQAADSVPLGERGLLLRLFACNHYLDTGQIPEAIASVEQAEALYEQSKFEKPQDICAEFVFVNAFYRQDLAAAHVWWQRIEALDNVDPDADYWRAKSALLWLKGEREEALEAWEQGHALAQRLPSAGAYDFTRSCFAKLRGALDAPRSMSPPPLESLVEGLASCSPVAVEA